MTAPRPTLDQLRAWRRDVSNVLAEVQVAYGTEDASPNRIEMALRLALAEIVRASDLGMRPILDGQVEARELRAATQAEAT